ncbi:hypothetical protein SAMN02799622_00827 [Methylobacterium sp. UNC378MF]|uniref:hypothetical protein n=1 Tax=Methylobacterium sp. UNC378MF TaxID=1502748 RepID=UPI00088BBA33|nr:hypothetical protein [Methylobacterium sp. UNC378MF]SDA12843.1 hypothetical protein SAMN02799622_00827 [Methylobacterium sp. UNC378MF]
MTPLPIYRQPLDGTEMVRVLKDGRFYMAPLSAVLDLLGVPATLAPILARLAALEGRPEEVAHFTASAKLPNAAALASFTLTLTGLVPARAGDVLKAGEQVEVRAKLPAGLEMGLPLVTADGTVAVSFKTTLALSAGTTPVTFDITALR